MWPDVLAITQVGTGFLVFPALASLRFRAVGLFRAISQALLILISFREDCRRPSASFNCSSLIGTLILPDCAS